MSTRRTRRRGFTIMEVMVVVGIVAVIAAVAVPGLYGAYKRQEVRTETRDMVSALRDARSLAMARGAIPGLVCGAPRCLPRAIGIRFLSRTSYEVFGDMDYQPGGDVVIQTVDITSNHPSNRVRYMSPDPGTVLLFSNSGTVIGTPPVIRLVDEVSNEEHIIDVTVAGTVSLRGT